VSTDGESYGGGYLYRQTLVERDGAVMRSKWLDAEMVGLWLHAVLLQGRRVKGLKLERIRAVAPAGHVDVLYEDGL
jgi:hypothetical protein